MSALLEIDGLTKVYPGVVANDRVSFDLAPGEIHALLGENGAGKSTLVKMIYGLIRPDAGTMRLGGAPYAPPSPIAARASGVAMVFQHFSLFDALSVAENITLGMTDPPPRRALGARIRAVSARYGLPIAPDRRIGDLSVGERQRVEIVRCLLQDPRILIMDEPTSVLTPQEAGLLFATLRTLAASGVAILYISHKLDEIRALCDRATVLRAGRVAATCTPANETARSMAEMMIGQTLALPPAHDFRPGRVLLTLDGLDLAPADAFATPLRDLRLTLRAGEVLGIAGVAGNGQDELMLALSGERLSAPAMIRLGGNPIGRLGPTARRARGLRAAPEERLGHAASPAMSLRENAALTGGARADLVRHGVLRGGAITRFTQTIVDTFDVRTGSLDTLAGALSGGNLQKFVIGREILQSPGVLAVNQPTWGVDARAAVQIRGALRDLAAQGAGVIVISQDLDELMEMTDSFAVLAGGRLSGIRPTGALGVEAIGRMMGGTQTDHATSQAEPAHAAP